MFYNVIITLVAPPLSKRSKSSSNFGNITLNQGFHANSEEEANQLAVDYISPFVKLGVEIKTSAMRVL